MSLPFELTKYHKRNTKSQWKQRGLIDDNIDDIYDRYIHSSQCELCKIKFEKKSERQMDHCHNTGKFRNIVCQQCNRTKLDKSITGKLKERYITEYYCNREKRINYIFKIWRNDKVVVQKMCVDLDKLIKIRDEWIKNNPQYFS